jgi:hypothetical protein
MFMHQVYQSSVPQASYPPFTRHARTAACANCVLVDHCNRDWETLHSAGGSSLNLSLSLSLRLQRKRR